MATIVKIETTRVSKLSTAARRGISFKQSLAELVACGIIDGDGLAKIVDMVDDIETELDKAIFSTAFKDAEV